jgi:hypothetical protein
MKYRNNDVIMPIRIAYYKFLNKFQIFVPSLLKTTDTKWVFDNISNLHDSGDAEWYNYYVISPNLSIIPRGCRVFRIKNENQSTTEIVPFSTLSPSQITKHTNIFMTFVVGGEGLVPLFTWGQFDIFTGVSKLFGILNPNNLLDVYNRVQTPYRHVTMYFIKHTQHLEKWRWKGTTECICMPTEDEEQTFDTFYECADNVYQNVKNKKSWVMDSSIPFHTYVSWWNTLSKNSKQQSLGVDVHANYIRIFIVIFLVLVLVFVFFLKKISNQQQ